MYDITSQVNGIPIRREFIGKGDFAIKSTLNKMKKIIRLSSVNYYVRRWAEEIIGLSETDKEKADAIFEFVVRNTHYVKDPHGFEFIRTPIVPLKLIEQGKIFAGDCDDLVVLSLSLAKSIGLPVALRAASYSIMPKKPFSHVYGLVKLDGRWIPFELVKQNGLGYQHPNSTRIMDMEV